MVTSLTVSVVCLTVMTVRHYGRHGGELQSIVAAADFKLSQAGRNRSHWHRSNDRR